MSSYSLTSVAVTSYVVPVVSLAERTVTEVSVNECIMTVHTPDVVAPSS